MSVVLEIGIILEGVGFLVLALGWGARPSKSMRLDRSVSGAERFQLERQRSAVRMGPYMRKAGAVLMIMGIPITIAGLIVLKT